MRLFHAIALVLLSGCSGDEPAPPPNPPPEKPVTPPPAKVDTAVPEAPNKPPQLLSAELLPKGVNGFQTLRAEVKTKDPDRDGVDVDYTWSVNGKVLLARRDASLPESEFEKGDEISLTITVSDKVNEPFEKTLSPITIANAPPTLLTDPGRLTQIDGFKLEANDPDGDSLTWRLEGEPKGMSIRSSGKSTGVLSYQGSTEEPGGAYQIKIIGDDGDGGTLEWSFGIEVTPGSAAPK